MKSISANYKDTAVWQLSMELVVDCYKLIKQFPSVERYGLETQLLGSAIDIAVCIAEAKANGDDNVYLGNISMVLGLLAQLETQVLIAERLYYCNEEQRGSVLDKIELIKWSLIRLQRSISRSMAQQQSAVS
ncbi:MAG: four helix bundle protein [Thiotrichales bacterium]|nr:four helix bundle protein [Thiotrichales bacterium]